MALRGVLGIFSILRWIVVLLSIDSEAERISIASTARWSEVNGSCTEWAPASQAIKDDLKMVLADAFDGIEVSDFSSLSIVCATELAIAFEISLNPSASEFNTKADELVTMLRGYEVDDVAREQLNVALQSVGYPATYGQLDFALWRCAATCVVLTESADNIVILWLGRNNTTPTPTYAPPTPEPEECTFAMLWLFDDLAKDSCGMQAATIFGGFGLLIICCPIIIIICRRKRKQIEALVCAYAPSNMLTFGADEEATQDEEKDVEEKDVEVEDNSELKRTTSNFNSLHEKAYAKQCSQLDEDLHKLLPAYKDASEVEFYSVKNACWTHAKVHLFASSKLNGSDENSNSTHATGEDSTNGVGVAHAKTCSSHRHSDHTRISHYSKRASHQSQHGHATAISTEATHQKVYGVELFMGEAQAVQYRYNVELNQLRLPLSQSESVEVCGKDDIWVHGKVEGPRTSTRKQIGYHSFRQQLGYNVRLTSGLLQKNIPAERIRRYFPTGSDIEYYAGADVGWVSGVVTHKEDPAAEVKGFALQPWNNFKKKNASMMSRAWNQVESEFTLGPCPSEGASVLAPSPSDGASDNAVTGNLPLGNTVDNADNASNSSAGNSTLGSSTRGRRKNEAWSNAMMKQAHLNINKDASGHYSNVGGSSFLNKGKNISGSSYTSTASSMALCDDSASAIAMRPMLWTLVNVTRKDGRVSESTKPAAEETEDVQPVDVEAAIDGNSERKDGRVSESRNAAAEETKDVQSSDVGVEMNGNSEIEIGTFLVRCRGKRQTCWL